MHLMVPMFGAQRQLAQPHLEQFIMEALPAIIEPMPIGCFIGIVMRPMFIGCCMGIMECMLIMFIPFILWAIFMGAASIIGIAFMAIVRIGIMGIVFMPIIGLARAFIIAIRFMVGMVAMQVHAASMLLHIMHIIWHISGVHMHMKPFLPQVRHIEEDISLPQRTVICNWPQFMQDILAILPAVQRYIGPITQQDMHLAMFTSESHIHMEADLQQLVQTRREQEVLHKQFVAEQPQAIHLSEPIIGIHMHLPPFAPHMVQSIEYGLQQHMLGNLLHSTHTIMHDSCLHLHMVPCFLQFMHTAFISIKQEHMVGMREHFVQTIMHFSSGQVQSFDMFPQDMHLHCIIEFILHMQLIIDRLHLVHIMQILSSGQRHITPIRWQDMHITESKFIRQQHCMVGFSQDMHIILQLPGLH